MEDIVTKEIYIDTHDEIILPSLPSGLMVKPALAANSETNVEFEYKVDKRIGISIKKD